MKRFTLTSLLALAAALASAQTKINPANQIDWPTCSSGQAYSPATNTCITAAGGLSGMTAAQVPIAATATTVTSSKALAGSGAGVETGPTSTTTGDCVKYADASGTLADAGSACGSSSGVSGSGTTGYFPAWTGSAALGNSHIDDGVTTGSTVTSTEKIVAPSFAGNGSDPFVNLPSNTGHSASSGDLWNNAGVLEFNDGTATRTVATQLTTTGTSGAATLSAGVLNIPIYSGGSSGATTQLAQTVIAGSSTTAITFSGISGGYTQLWLIINANSSDASSDELEIQFNADTGSNYDDATLFGGGSTPQSAYTSAHTFIQLNGGTPLASSSSAADVDIVIPNYAGTTFYKTLHFTAAAWSASGSFMSPQTGAGRWRNTAAITSIKIFFGSGDNLTAGSTATLYGVQ